jgi:hypothetical protein
MTIRIVYAESHQRVRTVRNRHALTETNINDHSKILRYQLRADACWNEWHLNGSTRDRQTAKHITSLRFLKRYHMHSIFLHSYLICLSAFCNKWSRITFTIHTHTHMKRLNRHVLRQTQQIVSKRVQAKLPDVRPAAAERQAAVAGKLN